MIRPVAGAADFIDWARDAARVRRGPLPTSLKRRVLQTRAGLFRRSWSTDPDSPATCSIIGHPFGAYSFKTLTLLFREAFVDLDYYFEARAPRPAIVDCGSNIGMSVLFFKSLYPQAMIVGFEPAAASFVLLRENLLRCGLDDVAVHNLAVGAVDETIEFFEAAKGSLTASANPHRASAQRTQVEQRRVSAFITAPVDLLKIDVEGSEWGVLQDLVETDRISMIDQMIIEYHHHLEPSDDRFAEFLALLQLHGFGYQIRAYMAARGVRGHFQDLLVHAYRKRQAD